MKKITLILILTFITMGLFAQAPNYKKFRTGTFKMSFNNQSVIVKRSATMQLEYLNGSKIPASFTVNWLNSFTYTLTPAKDFLAKHPAVPKNALITTKIIKTTQNSYTAITTSNFYPKVLTNEIFKISDDYK